LYKLRHGFEKLTGKMGGMFADLFVGGVALLVIFFFFNFSLTVGSKLCLVNPLKRNISCIDT